MHSLKLSKNFNRTNRTVYSDRLCLTIESENNNLEEETALMPHPNLSSEETAQRGEELYQKHIRAQVETTENIGKIIAINLTTGNYEIDKDLLVACHRLKANQPDAVTWIERIGYDAVYAIGGTLVRTAQ